MNMAARYMELATHYFICRKPYFAVLSDKVAIRRERQVQLKGYLVPRKE